MEEGTIFQGPQANNPPSFQVPPSLPSAPPSPPPGIDEQEKGFLSRISPPGKIVKIALIIFAILTVFFVFVGLILPRLNKESTEKVTLSYWGLWEDQNVMDAVVSEFERENPNIDVKFEKHEVKEYRERLTVRSQNGTGPDVFRFHNTWYPMLSDLLLPLPKDIISQEEFDKSYFDVTSEDLIKNGAIYGVPLGIDTLALYVNSQLFSDAGVSPPTTWQEFIEASDKLTKRGEDGKIEVAGAGIGTFENVVHAPDIISLLFAQNGVDFEKFEQSPSKVSDALTFYTNFALIENNVWDGTLDSSMVAFSSGKSAMFFGYSWDYFLIKSLNPNLSFSVENVPQLLKSKPVNIASYWAEGVSAKSKHQKEALLFIKFLAKPETAEKLYTEESKTRSFGEPYANKNLTSKLQNSDAFVFADQAKTAVSSPFVDSTYDNGLNDRLNTYLKDAANGILTSISVETAVETLFQGYLQVFGQYVR